MSQAELKEMVSKAVHFGHQTHKWNPKMRPYLYGARDGVHIFDLQKTFDMMQEALSFLKKSIAEGKVVLFVSTKQQASSMVRNLANKCKMPYVTNKWIGGLLTNFPTVKKRIKYYLDLKEQAENGDFEKYTKKEVSKFKKEIEKLESSLGGLSNLKRVPDVVFVVDAVRDNIAVVEANKLNIPVVGVVDSNANPDQLKYPIPGNDDSISALKYYFMKVEDAILNAQKKSN